MGGDGRLRVAVLMGGTSAEHDVSVCSGLHVLDALEPGFRATPVYVDPAGVWRFGTRPERPSLEVPPGNAEPSRRAAPSVPGGSAPERGTLETLRGGCFDVVFVALHGPGGEDGSVQGLLTLAGVPFTGSGVLASALAMDKVRTKQLLGAAGVPFAEHREVTRDLLRAGDDEIYGRLPVPSVVKPVRGGSSFGTRVVRRREDLPEALRAALDLDGRALVEAYVPGVEVTCGVLGGGAEPAEALPLTEIVPKGEEFFDFRAKYTASACDEITPARVDAETSARAQELAVTAHTTLGCEGMSRTDFIVGPEGPVMLETNTIPGLTGTSLLPQGAAAAGIDFPALVRRLIGSALRRDGRDLAC